MVEGVLGAGGAAKADSGEGLQAIWGALNIARENKALIVTEGGVIINANELAAALCECAPERLAGASIVQFLEAARPPGGAPSERFETALTAASGLRIPVEVTCQPLRTARHVLEVYAIRALRE